jgi:hypothetical protein
MATATDAGPAADRKLVKMLVAREPEPGELVLGEDPASADLPFRVASKAPGSDSPDWPLEDVGMVSVPKGFKGQVVEAGGSYWILEP